MAAIALLLGGLGVAAYLVFVKLSLEYDPEFKSACNFGDKLNCDAVQTSQFATLFGVPIALLAIPTYFVMIFFALMGMRSEVTRGRPRAIETARNAVFGLGGVAALTVVFSLYLGFVSFFKLDTACIYCMTLWGINAGAFVCAFLANRTSFGELFSSAVNVATSFKEPVLASLGVLVIGAVVAYGGYTSTQKNMEAAYKDKIDAAFGDAFAEGEEAAPPIAVPPAADQAAAAGQQAAAAAQAPPAAAQQGAAAAAAPPTGGQRMSASAKKPPIKKTENGLSYFEIPFGPQDFPKGPATAPVTVVKFADFECGYCRVLHLNMKPLVEKYKDQVQWVMKHYPMNADCNPRMGGERMHPNACVSSFAAECAGQQDKFWEMHDKLYENQQKLDAASVRGYAEGLGLDLAKYDACMSAPATKQKILDDVKLAGQAFIYGTPRAYVNGRLVSGSASTSILEYYIQKSLEEIAAGGAVAQQVAPQAATAQSPTMLESKTASGPFWIDAFEASIDKSGKAVTVPNVMPYLASWYQAKEACTKAGKRLCTEEEWTAACTGTPPIDNNNNGWFNDDDVEGRMYPYGAFYEAGTCRDAEDEYKGKPGNTGALPGCRTPEGIYDLTGNLAEWVNPDEAKASTMGGDWRGGERSACNRRSATFGPGQANDTIGFRCCADKLIEQGPVDVASLQSSTGEVLGRNLPEFEIDLMGGGKYDSKSVKGKVTYLTFFASWCGSCKRELPELNSWAAEYPGLEVIAVGVDKNASQSENFVKPFNPTYKVGLDPNALALGHFNINAMPTSFVIDKKGVVRHSIVGFKQEEVPMIKKQIAMLLAE
jgi:protein-disulfide isomerase/uncharacterized membrane protein/peroxiredoxin